MSKQDQSRQQEQQSAAGKSQDQPTAQSDNNTQLEQQLTDLQDQVSQLKEQVLRAQADYQNLQRRTQQERQRIVKLANRDLVENLLEPLEHLEMTAEQVSDQALDMVTNRLRQTLKEFGVEEINPVGEDFSADSMEAVEGSKPEAKKVKEVRSKGYKLNGEVIRHAKVVVA